MIEFQVVKTMDEKEWEDHIFYSGADSYPWWVEFLKPDHNGEIGLYHIDPDSETYYTDQPELHWTTLRGLADTASRFAPDHPVIMEAILNDDFDANAADIVLQLEVFGEVVYG